MRMRTTLLVRIDYLLFCLLDTRVGAAGRGQLENAELREQRNLKRFSFGPEALRLLTSVDVWNPSPMVL